MKKRKKMKPGVSGDPRKRSMADHPSSSRPMRTPDGEVVITLQEVQAQRHTYWRIYCNVCKVQDDQPYTTQMAAQIGAERHHRRTHTEQRRKTGLGRPPALGKKKAPPLDLTRKRVSELREMAKAAKIVGYSKMKKADLIEALKGRTA